MRLQFLLFKYEEQNLINLQLNTSKLNHVFNTHSMKTLNYFRKVYIFATHGIFSGEAANILKECSNLEKVRSQLWG